jgi:hypothetical protein
MEQKPQVLTASPSFSMKKAWHLIGPNIFYMVLEFSRLRKLPTGINISHTAFVPKSKLSTEFSE